MTLTEILMRTATGIRQYGQGHTDLQLSAGGSNLATNYTACIAALFAVISTLINWHYSLAYHAVDVIRFVFLCQPVKLREIRFTVRVRQIS